MNKTSLIYKVLSNAASASEKKELDGWLKESEENEIEFNDVKLLWETSNDSDFSFSKAQILDGFIKIKALMHSKLRRRERSRRSRIWIVLLVIAALLFTYAYFQKLKSQDLPVPLTFNKVTLEEIVKELENEYDVRIELENKEIGACTFSGIFYQSKNVDEVLQTLDQALNLQHELKKKGEYLVTGSGCQ